MAASARKAPSPAGSMVRASVNATVLVRSGLTGIPPARTFAASMATHTPEVESEESSIPPPPPPGSPVAERDAFWREHVYLGNEQRQFTLRAVIIGGLFGGLIAVTNLYITLKTGWGLGLGIIAMLGTYTGMNILRNLTNGRIAAFTMLENNCMCSTAASAGSSTGTTLVGAFGGLMLITGGHAPWPAVSAVVLLTALLGVFLAIPFKRQMINDEELVFPSATAGAAMLKGLYANGAEGVRKARALFGTLAIGGIFGLFRLWAELATRLKDAGLPYGVFSKLAPMTIPDTIPLQGLSPVVIDQKKIPLLGLFFEPSLLLTSVGLIVGMRVSLSMFSGSCLLYFVLAPIMASADATMAGGAGFLPAMPMVKGMIAPAKWALWGGTALMVMASFATLALQWKTLARAFAGILPGRGPKSHDAQDALEVPVWWMAAGVIPIGLALVVTLWLGFGVNPLLGVLSLVISMLVSVVCCRSAGEADINPVGPMGKVTQLVFAFLPGAAGNAAINLVAAGTTSAAGGSSADMMADFRTSHLLGANARKVWWAQLLGVFFGLVFVVPTWYLLIQKPEDLDGGKFTAVPAQMWSTVARLLTSGDGALPHGAKSLMVVCALIGVMIPVAAKLWPRCQKFLPSTMGLGLSFVLPLANSLSFLIGSLIMLAWEKGHKKSATAFALTVAAGLMSGQAIVEAFTQLGLTALDLGHGRGWW